MKFRLTLLWLLASVVMMAQPEFTLKSGEQLSELNQFGRSTEQLEAFIQANPSRLYDQSQALLLISYNHLQLGDYAGALAANEASLQIKAQLHADDLAYNYVRFGAIHLLRGNHHAALSYLLKAKNYPIEELPLYAVIDGYLASAYRGLSQFERAEMYYRQSIETLLIEYAEDHPEVITGFYDLGKLYLEWEKPEEARRYLQLGLERSSEKQALLQTLLYNAMGESFPDSPTQAEAFHRQALETATAAFGAYHRETARSGIFLANALYRQGRREDARSAIQLAIKSLAPEEPKLSWEQLPDTARLIIDPALLAEALGFKARWLLEADLPTGQSLPLTLLHSEIAARLLMAALDDRIDRADRTELIRIARKALEPGIAAGVRLWEDRKDPDAQRRAFQLLETVKMLEFRAYTAGILHLSGTFAEKERELYRSIQMAEIDFRRQPLDLTASQEVYRLRAKYRQLKSDWYAQDPASYRQRFGMAAQSAVALQDQLEANTLILSYFVGKKTAYLFGLDRTGLHALALEQADPEVGIAAELTMAVQEFQRAIDEKHAPDFVAYGDLIFQRLLAPAASWLKAEKTLHILPDGPLRQLPFEALLTKTYRRKHIQFHKLPYLVHDFAVQYGHTASASWATPAGSAPAYELSFLSPVFDRQELAGIRPSQRLLFDPELHPASAISDGEQFYLLPQATAEADQLQALFDQAEAEGRFNLRTAATKGLFQKELRSAHYLHLASYAFVEGASPEEAGLVLVNGEISAGVPDEGLLSASELVPQSAPATELVSIDFVELGKEGISRSAGIIPLSGRLLLAGVSKVLYGTRLDSAPSFFPSFYEYVLQGESLEAASQMVKRALAKNKGTATPHLWSGFRLVSK